MLGLVYKDPTLYTHFTWSIPLEAPSPNTVTFEVRASAYDFEGCHNAIHHPLVSEWCKILLGWVYSRVHTLLVHGSLLLRALLLTERKPTDCVLGEAKCGLPSQDHVLLVHKGIASASIKKAPRHAVWLPGCIPAPSSPPASSQGNKENGFSREGKELGGQSRRGDSCYGEVSLLWLLSFTWGWIFFFNLPVFLDSLGFSRFLIPKATKGSPELHKFR